MTSKQAKTAIFAALASILAAGVVLADGLNNNEVRFTGKVETVIVNGEGVGTLFVTLDTFELRVIVNPRTLILSGEDILTLDMLSDLADKDEELQVEVTGKYSSSGILANRLEVLDTDADNSFHVRGHITRIRNAADGVQVSLLGITILVNEDTDVLRAGLPVSVSELRIGTRLEAEGLIDDDGVWTASVVRILSGARKKGLVFFEGTIVSFDEGQGILRIDVSGAEGDPITVHVNRETRIIGDLDVGALVLVIGTINPDYSFVAKEVRVLPALEIKPDERKLKVGETATFTVKLREIPAADVVVTLGVDAEGEDVIDLSVDTVTVTAGTQTAQFTVTALAAGTAVITAGALDEEATALVKVGELSEDDNERPDADVRISFSPDHVKVKPNETREVVLHIKPPQNGILEVVFESKDPTIVPVPTSRRLSNGAASMKVLLQSTGQPGRTIITASALGAEAELIVEVSAPKKEK
jgi:hypothetical protein